MLDVSQHLNPADRGGAAATPQTRRLRVAVFIEHNIVYRHFIMSSAFSELVRKHEVVFVIPENGPLNKRLTVKLDEADAGAPVATIAINAGRLYQQRRLFQVNQLVWRPGAEWKHLRAVIRFMLGPRTSALYTTLALPGLYQLLRGWSSLRVSREPSAMEDFIGRFKPDVLVHPTVLDGLFINDFVLLGRKHGIPTVAIMNSWDNPSTKRAVLGPPDWLLVWGAQTRGHAATFMGMDPAHAVPFGAAQFDIYRKPPRESRESFCRRHGIDPNKRVLLYAGSSKGADEFAHLCMIEEAIDRGVLPNLAVIYRPHPWGQGGFGGERLLGQAWRHVAIEASMRGYLEGVQAGKKGQYLADYADTHDVLSCVDALVSPLSTILLEGAIHRLPVLCFLADEKEGSSFGLQKQLFHFEEMFANPLILKANGDAGLIDALVSLIGRIGDTRFAEDLRRSCQHYVAEFDRPYAERLCAFVEGVAAGVEGRLAP